MNDAIFRSSKLLPVGTRCSVRLSSRRGEPKDALSGVTTPVVAHIAPQYGPHTTATATTTTVMRETTLLGPGIANQTFTRTVAATTRELTVGSSSKHAALGVVRYVGKVEFAKGTWIGVELDTAEDGRHNGVVGGKQYFVARRGCGVFVRPKAVVPHSHEYVHTNMLMDESAEEAHTAPADLSRTEMGGGFADVDGVGLSEGADRLGAGEGESEVEEEKEEEERVSVRPLRPRPTRSRHGQADALMHETGYVVSSHTRWKGGSHVVTIVPPRRRAPHMWDGTGTFSGRTVPTARRADVCGTCGEALGEYYALSESDGRVCSHHVDQACGGDCGRVIAAESDFVFAEGSAWHLNCFACGRCGDVLDDDVPYLVDVSDNVIVCIPCSTARV